MFKTVNRMIIRFLVLVAIVFLLSLLVKGQNLKKSFHKPDPKWSLKSNYLNVPAVGRKRRSGDENNPKSFLEGILNRKSNRVDPESNYPQILSGKLQPNGQNWFTVLPTPVLIHRVSLRTIVGLYVTSIGHRRINQIISEAQYGSDDADRHARLHLAATHLLYYITFLKEGICTFGVVSMNRQIYSDNPDYSRFLTVTSDYLLSSAHLYKHAVSKYKLIHPTVVLPSVFDVMLHCFKTLPSAKECYNPRSDILTKYKCLPTCKSDNTCKEKSAYLPKLMKNVLYFFISEFTTLEDR